MRAGDWYRQDRQVSDEESDKHDQPVILKTSAQELSPPQTYDCPKMNMRRWVTHLSALVRKLLV